MLDIIKNQPIVNVIRTAVRVSVVSPKSFMCQPSVTSKMVLIMTKVENVTVNT